MSKEHILQFAISIDEERIVSMVEEKATKAGVDSINKAVAEKTIGRGHWTPSYIEQCIDEKVGNVVKEHKDEIIDKAAEKLAEKLVRTKAVKSKVGEVLENV